MEKTSINADMIGEIGEIYIYINHQSFCTILITNTCTALCVPFKGS